MDYPLPAPKKKKASSSKGYSKQRRKEGRSIDIDDSPPRRRRNNGGRGARSNDVIVIDGSDNDDNISVINSSDDERKPAAKASTTTTASSNVSSKQRQQQSRCISLLDDDNSSEDDSSVQEIQTNNIVKGRKRSRSNKLSVMMNNFDSDRALAEKLQKKEEAAAHNIAKANPLREQRLMTQSTDGKAVLAVQEIMSLVTETRNIAKKYKNYNLVNYIAAVTREDMFHFAKAMLELQQEFLKQRINGYIDVGYHYTASTHMANIRQHGLLTKKDRDSQRVNSTLHGSVFGDGIYTANNPDNFSSYGNTGVLVARLTGKMVRVARSLLPNTKVDANTIVGDKMMHATALPMPTGMGGQRHRGKNLDKDGWPLKDDYHEIVLRSSAQCLPMISYDSRARQTKEGQKCIKNMEKGLQDIFDKLFNKGMKRSSYEDSEILNAPIASYHPLPAFNGLNMGLLPPASLNAILPPGFPAPLPGMGPLPAPFPGIGPSIASSSTRTFGGGSTTTARSSLQMARQRMRGNVPLSTATNSSTLPGNTPVTRTAMPSTTNTLSYKAPKSLTTGIPPDAMSTPDSSCDMEEDCVICQDPLHKRRKCAKLKCGHIFHKECIQRAFQSKPQCPVCRKSIGAPVGKCPSGTMTTTTSSMRCSGFREGSIVITYVIPAGRQMSYHDNPGTSHASKHATAYIPNNTDGQALLKRLKYAFLHGLTFNVGTSITTGAKNQCTWASIHHKTSPSGGVQAHGFPDPDYFNNCNAELDGLGVPPAHSLDENGNVK
eukprot:scaffold5845_cov73-Skeletonema_dohrnii-CCMP3373.AAC.2